MARTHGPVKSAGVNSPGVFFRPRFLRLIATPAVLIWLCGPSHVSVHGPFNYNTGHFGVACAAAQHCRLAGAFRNCQENPS